MDSTIYLGFLADQKVDKIFIFIVAGQSYPVD
jgi:hypothetical protein